jgi:hypothetical protein
VVLNTQNGGGVCASCAVWVVVRGSTVGGRYHEEQHSWGGCEGQHICIGVHTGTGTAGGTGALDASHCKPLRALALAPREAPQLNRQHNFYLNSWQGSNAAHCHT